MDFFYQADYLDKWRVGERKGGQVCLTQQKVPSGGNLAKRRRFMVMVLRRRRPACRTRRGNATEVKMWAEGTSPDLSQQPTKVGEDMEQC